MRLKNPTKRTLSPHGDVTQEAFPKIPLKASQIREESQRCTLLIRYSFSTPKLHSRLHYLPPYSQETLRPKIHPSHDPNSSYDSNPEMFML